MRRPRDAACLIIIDRTHGAPRILMGRRRADQVFLPDKFVFPGGRVEASDRTAACVGALHPATQALLLLDMKPTASVARARALALCAVRETFEETGVLVGLASSVAPKPAAAAWSALGALGIAPKIGGLRLLARAITPPGRSRRYDTRFFCVSSEEIVWRTAPRDAELSDIGWFTMEEAQALDVPDITRVILSDLADQIAREDRAAYSRDGVPFYLYRRGKFERRWLVLA